MSKPDAGNVAAKFFGDRTAAGDESIPEGQLIDLVAFLLSWDAYLKIKGPGDPLQREATKLLVRYMGSIGAGLKEHFEPLVEEEPSFKQFKAELRQATRPSRSVDQAMLQAEFVKQFLPVLRAKPVAMEQVFTDRRAMTTARRVGSAASQEPAAMLGTIASAPHASRLRLTKNWIQKAAAAADVGPSSIEKTMNDAAEASRAGEELRKIEARLDNTDPDTPEAADLQVQKQDLLDDVQDLADHSDNPEVVVAAAATAAAKERSYATETSRQLGLSPSQEEGLLVRGKAVLAAGAGSGKTRVLAGKVAYHINELGVNPQNILATSFSRKSAAELKGRIENYGAKIPQQASSGFGTTHSVAGKLMRDYGRGRAGREGVSDYQQTHLVLLAMQQVQMGAPGQFGEPPPPKSLFQVGPGAPEPESEDASAGGGMTFKEACEQAFQNRGRMSSSFLRGFIESYFNQRDKWYGLTMRKTKNLTDPGGLSDKQKKILADIFRYTGVDYDVYDPAGSGDPNFAGTVKMGATNKKLQGLKDRYEFFSRPGKQWFNLGLVMEDDDGKPLPPGEFKQAITKWKGRLVSPSEAWDQTAGSDAAAVYAAYEWLKSPRGEPDFQGKGDFDDVLIDCSRMLLSSPTALKQVQSRFKVVLVDEAQDLNRAQHMMFGLISGYIDPAKAAMIGSAEKVAELAKDDGSMTADTYVLIGDDKQAIYEFRSADPEAFIDMSDLVEGGAGFKTVVLETNYRSGKQIVDAAQRLISHNSKQIPMVCKANPGRADEGGIKTVSFAPDSTEAAAAWMADSILSEVKEGIEPGGESHAGYDSFGVGLRTNAEAYIYGMELLKRGIPFKSKVNFFRDTNAKALLGWLTIADEGLNGNEDRINQAVIERCHRAPLAGLGKKTMEKIRENATGNYIVWLRDNWGSIYGRRGQWAARIKSYVDNLVKVATMEFEDQEDLLNEILQLTGYNDESVRDAMIDRIKGDKETMAEIMAQSSTGEIDEDLVEEAALAPIAPIKGLLNARADLAEAMKYTRQLERANEKLTAVDDPSAQGFEEPAVTLGTMHSWKGLEVPHMYIPMVGGRFPRGGSEEDLASERRLAYVAITRGEDKVTVMNIPTTRNVNGKPMVFTSQFIEEMCVPMEAALPSEAVAEIDEEGAMKTAAPFVSLPAGVSPQDPALMDAYLEGDSDPLDDYEEESMSNLEDEWVF